MVIIPVSVNESFKKRENSISSFVYLSAFYMHGAGLAPEKDCVGYAGHSPHRDCSRWKT